MTTHRAAVANSTWLLAEHQVFHAALTAQVFDKARALGPRDWVLDSSAEATAVLDPTRVTEAWLELATNAVKYSPPGSPIRLGSLVAGDELLLQVALPICRQIGRAHV